MYCRIWRPLAPALVLLLVTCAAFACSGSGDSSRSTFAYHACDVALPAGQVDGETVRCGTLTVLEDRLAPERGTIQLPVVIFKASGKTTARDPLIYLGGGP